MVGPRSSLTARTAAVAVSVLALVLLVAGVAVVRARPTAAATSTVSGLFAQLTVRADVTSGYDRDLFEHWIDADHDGCDTRREVLIAESTISPTITAGCTVAGSWLSYYDEATWTDPADVDIDHLVPLAEAWRSGAAVWTAAQRRAYANDLDFGPSLVAVTDNVNQAKGDQDPAQWMPSSASATCRYLTEWVEVKYRWNLSVDTAEQTFLAGQLAGPCGATSVTVPPVAGPATPSGFIDVPASHPFAADITWLASAGIAGGYPDGTFRPGAVVSRQAIAAFLYRYTEGADAPLPSCSQQWYIDVPVGSEFCGAITWLSRTGIAGGYSDGTFRPAAPVSRQAMAAFLQRYRNAEASTGTACTPSLFTDMPAGDLCVAVTWLASTGIAGGYTDGSFKPTAPVSRQATAAFLHRYDDAFGPSDPPFVVTPPPPPTTTTTTSTTTTTPSIPPNPGNSKNCGDFATYAQAKAWFDTYFPYYGDVAQLDGDHDGIPCEALPGAP